MASHFGIQTMTMQSTTTVVIEISFTNNIIASNGGLVAQFHHNAVTATTHQSAMENNTEMEYEESIVNTKIPLEGMFSQHVASRSQFQICNGFEYKTNGGSSTQFKNF